uniref:CD99 antigen-like protein 2 n=1 Tax=Bos taurus TaxID=9913 RepID=A0AAA9TEL0_BOVIN
MVAWRWACLICLAFSLTTLVQRGSGDTGGFRLEDAVEGTSSVKQRWDHVTTTTRRPGATRAPAKPAGPPAEDDFNLADALDDQNDRDHDRKKPSIGGGGFSDKDLEDIVGGGDYKPDKGKGGGQYGGGDNSDDSGMSAETGTIAGVASALAMALIGAVSSYISYQQKKFCFSIQQGLNADYVKGENLEAVVCEEPQDPSLVGSATRTRRAQGFVRNVTGAPPGPQGQRCQTDVCTGVTECDGEEPRSDEAEARAATSRCRSSTRFCSSARTASNSLRFWWVGVCGRRCGQPSPGLLTLTPTSARGPEGPPRELWLG